MLCALASLSCAFTPNATSFNATESESVAVFSNSSSLLRYNSSSVLFSNNYGKNWTVLLNNTATPQRHNGSNRTFNYFDFLNSEYFDDMESYYEPEVIIDPLYSESRAFYGFKNVFYVFDAQGRNETSGPISNLTNSSMLFDVSTNVHNKSLIISNFIEVLDTKHYRGRSFISVNNGTSFREIKPSILT